MLYDRKKARQGTASKMAFGMRVALADLRLDAVFVVYRELFRHPSAPQVEAVSPAALLA